MEVQAGSEDQHSTQQAMERRFGVSSGWQQLMDGRWLGCYGMCGWEETLHKLYL